MDSKKHPIGLKHEGQVIEGEAVVESGPRSLRPRGSRGSASTLKLVGDALMDCYIAWLSLRVNQHALTR